MVRRRPLVVIWAVFFCKLAPNNGALVAGGLWCILPEGRDAVWSEDATRLLILLGVGFSEIAKAWV